MELFTRRAFRRQECTVHLKSAYAIENKTKNAIQQHRGICTSAPSRVRAQILIVLKLIWQMKGRLIRCSDNNRRGRCEADSASNSISNAGKV